MGKQKRGVPVINEEAKRNQTKFVVEPILGPGSVPSLGTSIDDNNAHIPILDEDELEIYSDACHASASLSRRGMGSNYLEKKMGKRKLRTNEHHQV
ncbi:hypothetical protein CASFOL_019669 [Castilleja foliolosa]|uniref:Uncharacterized protein n=1 Tax=Castilleja foliolosa TaxID=1961234 RepID=A0ABD3D069_9LAMI